jgi:hypothetical protein
VTGGEDQPGFDPVIPGTGPVSALPFLVKPERGDTQIGQRQGRLRGFCLDVPAEQLVTDSLDLLTDIEFRGPEVDQLPGKPEHLTLAQAQDQNQAKGGIERFSRGAC